MPVQCERGSYPMIVKGIPGGYGINVTKSVLDTFLASFPGLPHFQFLIPICETVAYCKQYIYIYIYVKIGSGEVL